MFRVETYMNELISLLHKNFNNRLVYVGLQGSYLRGEATENSDIDIMVVIDGMTIADMDRYAETIRSLDNAENSCGFICSKEDLANWNPLEICHLLNSTKDYYGALASLVPEYTQNDVHNFVKMSVNNLYHEICHRYIHASKEKCCAKLPGAYKGVFFILQNLYYLEHREIIQTKAQLLPLLSGTNKEVLHTAIRLGKGEKCDFAESFALLFTWCQEIMKYLSS